MMTGLEELFKNCDQQKLKEALSRAKMLSENPQVQQAMSRVDKQEILEMLRTLGEQDKQKLMQSFFQTNHRELIHLISKLK